MMMHPASRVKNKSKKKKSPRLPGDKTAMNEFNPCRKINDFNISPNSLSSLRQTRLVNKN